jgi:hypothetical protein
MFISHSHRPSTYLPPPVEEANPSDLESGLGSPTASEPINIQGATPRDPIYINDDEDMDLDQNDDYSYEENDRIARYPQVLQEDCDDMDLGSEEEDYYPIVENLPIPPLNQSDDDPRFVSWKRTAFSFIIPEVNRQGRRRTMETPLRIRVLRRMRTPEEVEEYRNQLEEYQMYSDLFSGWCYTRGRRSPPSSRRLDFSAHQNDFEY